jgi:transposase
LPGRSLLWYNILMNIIPINEPSTLPTFPADLSALADKPAPLDPPPAHAHALRLRVPQRTQAAMRYGSLDDLLPSDHPVRLIWQLVGTLDLSAFAAPIKAREHSAGRAASDPRLLVSLWLWASLDNVYSGRELAALCQEHLAYQWLCGEVPLNYHTLNDFRVGHGAALDALFTQILGRLMQQGLVQVQRITQDGLRVRASAGTGSFKRSAKLQVCLREAQAHLADLQRRREEDPTASTRRQAAQQAAAQARLTRVQQAVAAWQDVAAHKQERQSNPTKRATPTRASTTDPDARKMKMANGGFNPAYNVQVASDPESRAIVGVQATNGGGDAVLSEPMRRQIQAQTGQTVREQILDGGYVSLAVVERAAPAQVTLYMPVPEAQKEGQERFAPRPYDSAAVAAWRVRMGTPEGQTIYGLRAQTCETINADIRTWRGLGRFLVRGLAKVQCAALWSALAYNVLHFGRQLLGA